MQGNKGHFRDRILGGIYGLLSVCGLLFASSQAIAFKVDTHIYIAQEIINDIADDGHVTIEIDGSPEEFPVSEETVVALTGYSSFFRMGSLGPDAFPGVLAGQTVIHPGHENPTDWGTGHWLNYVSESANVAQGSGRLKAIAFALGFNVHAASDAFAHTYVNHYAGDVWDITDELVVERRHFILESFIASKNPPLKDHKGRSVGEPAAAVLDDNGNLAVPAEHIANTMIFSPVSRRYEESAPHLAFLGQHERNLGDAVKKSEDIAVEIERTAAFLYSGFWANESDIRSLRNMLNRIRKALVPVDELKELSDEITKIRIAHVEIQADIVEGLLNELVSVYGDYQRLRSDVYDAGQEAAKAYDDYVGVRSVCRNSKKLINGHCQVKEEVCGWFGPFEHLCKEVNKLDPVCAKQAQKVYEQALKACDTAADVLSVEAAFKAARKLQLDLENELLGVKDDLVRITNEIEKVMIAQIELENALIQAGLDTVKIAQGDLNIVVALLKGWRQGVRRSGTAYVLANGQAMVNAITPGLDPIDPLSEWFECYSLPLAGLPHPANDALCSFGEASDSVLSSLREIAKTLGQVEPVSRLTYELISELERQIKALVREGVISVLQEVTGQPIRELLRIIEEPATVETVTEAFTAGEESGLRPIPDAAFRVAAEMYLSQSTNQFDPQRYNVVYNAITLSKLSLLSHEQLNEVAIRAGVSGATIYGDQLYGPTDSKSGHVLVGALRSIDGSYQWLERGMPFLRTWGHEHPPIGRYSYPRDQDPKNGFRFWVDQQARDLVFRRIFRGPLVPGIDAPYTIGFPPLLLENYPYRICDENPWPDENDPNNPDVIVDASCSAPALTEMLEANPDPTMENLPAMLAVHKLLAQEDSMATGRLAGEPGWRCISESRDGEGLHSWMLRFSTDGKMSGTVFYRLNREPAKVAHTAAIGAGYQVIGEFLFTSPTSAGFVEVVGNVKEIPTLTRRLTEHPQRFRLEFGKTSPLTMTNQDGTKLVCESALSAITGG